MAYLGQQSDATSGTGVVDHIAFRATGLRKTMSRLAELEVEFSQRQVSDQGLYQLFLFDPNGIKIELNFDAAEAAKGSSRRSWPPSSTRRTPSAANSRRRGRPPGEAAVPPRGA